MIYLIVIGALAAGLFIGGFVGLGFGFWFAQVVILDEPDNEMPVTGNRKKGRSYGVLEEREIS